MKSIYSTRSQIANGVYTTRHFKDKVLKIQTLVSYNGKEINIDELVSSGNLSNVTTELGNAINEHTSKLIEMSDNIKQLDDRVKILESTKTLHETMIDKNTSDISDNKEAIDVLTGNMKEFSTSIEDHEANITKALEDINSNLDSIETLSSRIDSNDQSISNLILSVNTNTSDISNLTTNVNTNTSNISTLTSRIDDIEINGVTGDFSNYIHKTTDTYSLQKYNENKNDNGFYSYESDGLTIHAGDVPNWVDQELNTINKKYLVELQENMIAINLSLTGMIDQVSDHEQQIVEIQPLVSENGQKITNIEDSISNHNDRITILEEPNYLIIPKICPNTIDYVSFEDQVFSATLGVNDENSTILQPYIEKYFECYRKIKQHLKLDIRQPTNHSTCLYYEEFTYDLEQFNTYCLSNPYNRIYYGYMLLWGYTELINNQIYRDYRYHTNSTECSYAYIPIAAKEYAYQAITDIIDGGDITEEDLIAIEYDMETTYNNMITAIHALPTIGSKIDELETKINELQTKLDSL